MTKKNNRSGRTSRRSRRLNGNGNYYDGTYNDSQNHDQVI
jgi:hypothetical protein